VKRIWYDPGRVDDKEGGNSFLFILPQKYGHGFILALYTSDASTKDPQFQISPDYTTQFDTTHTQSVHKGKQPCSQIIAYFINGPHRFSSPCLLVPR